MMPDEKTIKQILVEVGVYSWAIAQAGGEAELIRMFQDDFEGLVNLCQPETVRSWWYQVVENSTTDPTDQNNSEKEGNQEAKHGGKRKGSGRKKKAHSRGIWNRPKGETE
jgi:hypothetical protein